MPTPGNSINEATTGICGFTGTAFTSTPVTAHDVLIGGSTSSTIAQAAPTATAGIPLVSGGSSADPSFTTAVVAGGGTGAVTLTGVLIGNGTSAVTGNAVTQHDVLVGGSSNAITSVAPSATSGVPFISQGASSDPVFGTAVVAGGGTGATSFTAYTPVCAGTTTTNPLQSVASIGTSGQVLTSNGASNLPTFQTAPTGVFAPNANILIFDDFIGTIFISGNQALLSQQSWTTTGGFFTSVSVAAGTNPGVVANGSFAANDSDLRLGGTSLKPFILGGGALTINWIISPAILSGGTNRYTLRFGLGDTSNADEANGVYFEYSDNINSGNWVIKTAAGSSRTTTNSSTAVTTAFHNAQISINAAGTSATFTMDGVSLGTINTNLPTLGIWPFVDVIRSLGTIAASSVIVDLFYLNQSLTTAR